MLQKSSTEKTLEIFFQNPTKEHYLMDISKKIKLSHTSVKNNLNKLVKKGIIIREYVKKGKRKFPIYKANRENIEFKNYKKLSNLRKILESGLIPFLENSFMPKSIVLFGSFERGEDVEDSDVDLFLECKQENLDLTKFKKVIGRKVELHFNKDFSSYPKELKNNIINGTILHGFLEGYK